MRIGVLGPLQVDEKDPRLGMRDRVVLAALASRPGAVLSPEQLADAVWGDSLPVTWAKNLQGCISRLRKALGADAIETSAHGYRLRLPADAVDIVKFERGARRAAELLTLREYEHARYVAAQSLDLWRGQPLAELEQWEAGSAQAGRLTELRWELEEIVVEASLAAGHHREVLAQAAAMAQAAPLRERRWALLARAQYQAGQQTDALRSLRRIKLILQQELGLDPSLEVTELEQAILRQDSSLVVAPAPEARDQVSPYQGLAPYGESDAEAFFGRDEEIGICVDRLGMVSLLAVVGPSGSGKSSLLRAGLVPALRREGARVVVITPGAHPGDSLASARPRTTSVILVDQAEEAFSLCKDEEDRRLFFDALVAHTVRGKVVLAIRGDYTGELADHPHLAPLVERGLFLLGAMSAEALHAAIEGPALQHGLVLEPGLTDLLVREVEGEPGALPLLSHALRETWLHHEGRTLTVAGYQASGGIRGAVAKSAETLYRNIPEGDKSDLRELVLRLVIPGPEGEPVRSRIPRHQAVVAPAQDRLIEQMVAARLVTSDQGDVELAHEALVRAWPRLRGWLEDDLEGQRTRHRLTQAAGDWDALGRQPSELYRGARLVAVSEWVNAAHPQLTATEQQFLDASTELATAEERSAREQVRHEQKVNRRLRTLAGCLAGLVMLALVAGFVALHQSSAAQHAAVAADARRAGAAALLADEPRQRLMVAVAGARLSASSDTEQNVRAALSSRPLLVRTTSVSAPAALSQALSTPSGFVVTDMDHGVHLLDTTTLRQTFVAAAGGSEGEPLFKVPMDLSSPAHVLAVASQPPDRLPIRLLDSATLRLLPSQLSGLPSRRTSVLSLSVSGNGRYLAAAVARIPGFNQLLDDGRVMVWDLRTRQLIRRYPVDNPYEGVALDRTGRHAYESNPLTEYDATTGRVLWQQPEASSGSMVALQPRGRLVAETDANDPTVVDLVDASTGQIVRRLRGHQRLVTALTFSHDGTRVAASADDGVALVWDTTTGAELDRIDVGAGQVTGLTFSPSDQTLFTIAEPDHQVSAWDLSGLHTYVARVPVSHPSVGWGNARISPDGTRILTITRTNNGLVWKLVDTTEHNTRRIEASRLDSQSASSWAPDGSEFAVGWDHGIVDLFDGHTGRRLVRRRVLPSMVAEVSFSRNGRSLQATDSEGHVVRLDPTTLKPAGRMVKVPFEPLEVAASPDGRYAFVLTVDHPAKPYWGFHFDRYYLVDLQRDRIVRSGDAGVANGFYCDFSPDGRHVTVGGEDGQVAVIDLTTGDVIRPSLGNAYSGRTDYVRYDVTGSEVLLSSNEDQLAILDGRTGELLAMTSLAASEGGVTSNFAPDGSVVAASTAGHVFRWDPSARHALAFACSVTGRGLDRAEWFAVLPGEPWRQTCRS